MNRLQEMLERQGLKYTDWRETDSQEEFDSALPLGRKIENGKMYVRFRHDTAS